MERSDILAFLESSDCSVPYGVTLSAKKPGPHLVFVGSTHGNEPSGTLAFFKIFNHLKSNKSELSIGSLTFILGNPRAFAEDCRFIDENLNRAFRFSHSENYEGRRAREIGQFFERNPIDLVMDYHSVGQGDFKFLIYFDGQPQTRELALKISPMEEHFCVVPGHIEGLLVERALQFKIPAFGLEAGSHYGAKSIEVAQLHMVNALTQFGLIDRDLLPEPSPPSFNTRSEINIYHSLWPVRPTQGLRYTVELSSENAGTCIPKNTVYMEDENKKYIAEQEIYLLCPHSKINLKDADAGFICRKEVVKKEELNK